MTKNNEFMSMDQRLSAIESCTLSLSEFVPAVQAVPAGTSRARSAITAVDEKPASLIVVDNALVSFVAGVSKARKRDVKNCVDFSTAAASTSFNRRTDTEKWYEDFMRWMRILGWVSPGFSFNRYASSQKSFKVDQLIVEMIADAVLAAAGPAGLMVALPGIAEKAFSALKGDKEKLQLFESKTSSDNAGSVLVAPCMESADGDVVMAMSAVHYKGETNIKNILFTHWNSASLEIYRGADIMEFDVESFEGNKAAVIKKLGDARAAALEEVEIKF